MRRALSLHNSMFCGVSEFDEVFQEFYGKDTANPGRRADFDLAASHGADYGRDRNRAF